MGSDFGLTTTEIIFLAVAVLVTVPFVFFIRWIMKELRKENEAEKMRGPGPKGPGAN